MRYIKGLDTIRAMAIGIVIIQHWGPYGYGKIIPEGSFGVDVFFVLSGYLITRILLASRYECAESNLSQLIKSFYIRRALRIFPIYFLYVLVIYLLNDEYARKNLVYFLTYTTNFLVLRDGKFAISPTWSLSVEEQFYLVWPWIIIFMPRKYLLGAILSAIGIGIISTWGFQKIYGDYGVFLLLPCVIAFGTGALFAYVSLFNRYKKVVSNTFIALLPVSIILLFVHQFGHHLLLIRAVNSVIAVSLIIYVTRQNYNPVSRLFFNNSFLAYIGKISYGIYLYHQPIPRYYYIAINYLNSRIHFNDRLYRFLTVPPSQYFIQMTVMLILAALSYRYIESAFLKLKNRFAYTIKRKSVHSVTA
jgi:peptidoglycan/LPS O-acetylase OafA/YrhL